MVDRSLASLIIATSGGGTMRSERPKSIHLLCGRPMMAYVLEALGAVGVDSGVVITGPSGDWVSKRMLEDPVPFDLTFVEQRFDRGSADAALVGLSGFDDFLDEGDLLVIPADVPLVEVADLERLLEVHRSSGAACTALTVATQSGDALVIERDRHGRVRGLVDPESVPFLEIGPNDESVVGIYCVSRGLLAPAARRAPLVGPQGRQDLHSVIAVLAESGHPVTTALVERTRSLQPVDTRRELAEAEAALRRRTNLRWLDRGVTMIDPDRTYIDATVELGIDVTLFPGTILQGRTTIGDGCEIGPDTRLDRCQVGKGSVVEKTMARLAHFGEHCRIGPFAVVEPGSDLPDGTITGPFYASRAEG